VLGKLVLAGLRQLVLVFAQTPDDAASGGGDTAAELLHVALTRLPPRRNLGLHLGQMLLTRGG
jgi:hypothetical protein